MTTEAAHGHAQVTDQAKIDQENLEHLKNKHLWHKLHKYFHFPHPGNLRNFLHHLAPNHDHFEAIVDTSKFEAPPFNSLTLNQKRERALYGIYKLNQLNPDFFSPEEQRIIEPSAPGIVRNLIFHAPNWAIAANIAYSILYRPHWTKTAKFVVGALLVKHGGLQVADQAIETFGMYRRYKLLDKYEETLGLEQLCNIVDPNYSVGDIKHLRNQYDWGERLGDGHGHGHGGHGGDHGHGDHGHANEAHAEVNHEAGEGEQEEH